MDRFSNRVLLVDDEPALLDALVRQHRRAYDIKTAVGAHAAFRALERDGPFAVVVADYRMPEVSGIEVLEVFAQRSPATVRMMLTGQAELAVAQEALNRGQAFRFLTKPCAPDVFRAALNDALTTYQVAQAEHVLLEETVKGAIEVLVGILSLTKPAAFGRAARLHRLVCHITEELCLEDAWLYESAALLSQIGCIAVPDEVLARSTAGGALSEAERGMLTQHLAVARDVIGRIPRLQLVADMVYRQDGARGDEPSADRRAALGGRILATAAAFDELVSAGADVSEAVLALECQPDRHDAQVLQALRSLEREPPTATEVPIEELRHGMILDEDLVDDAGMLLATRGLCVNAELLLRLQNHGLERSCASGTVRVRFLGRTPYPRACASGRS